MSFFSSHLRFVGLPFLVLAGVVVVASPSYGSRARPDAPPSVVSTTVKLQTVIDANSEATGAIAHRSITHIETDALTAYGLTGTIREQYTSLHANGDYHRALTLGPLSWEEGRYKGQAWQRNENGITTNLRPDESGEGSDVRLLEADVTNPKNDVSLLGEASNPFPAYVVQVKRKHEAPYWMFYDKTTSLLERVEIGFPDERHVITLDDYRLANGVKEAWHSHETTLGNSANDWDEKIVSDLFGAPVTDADLKIPQSRTDLVVFPAGETTAALPVRFLAGYPIVHVSINGRGLDMWLDTAYSGMLLDSQVVKDLRLPTFGPHDSGAAQGDQALVHDMAVGSLTMRDVFVRSSEFYFHVTGEVKVVGVVGFDFLASSIVDIDYEKGTVGATQASHFVPPATPYIATLNLDDGVPMISAQFGSATGSKFVLSTVDSWTEIYASFWSTNPSLEPSPNVVKAPGGILKAPYAHVVFKSVSVAGIILGDVSALLISEDAEYSRDDRDGVLGQVFLTMFHTYLDYPDQRVYFVPTTRLQKELEAPSKSGS